MFSRNEGKLLYVCVFFLRLSLEVGRGTHSMTTSEQPTEVSDSFHRTASTRLFMSLCIGDSEHELLFLDKLLSEVGD